MAADESVAGSQSRSRHRFHKCRRGNPGFGRCRRSEREGAGTRTRAGVSELRRQCVGARQRRIQRLLVSGLPGPGRRPRSEGSCTCQDRGRKPHVGHLESSWWRDAGDRVDRDRTRAYPGYTTSRRPARAFVLPSASTTTPSTSVLIKIRWHWPTAVLNLWWRHGPHTSRGQSTGRRVTRPSCPRRCH